MLGGLEHHDQAEQPRFCVEGVSFEHKVAVRKNQGHSMSAPQYA